MWQADLDAVLGVLAGADVRLLVPAGALLAVHYACKGLRWRSLLGPEVPRLLAIRLTLVGFLLNNVVPARAGELGRPYLLAKNHPSASFSYALATLFGDKLMDLLFTLVCLLVAAAALPLPEFARAGAVALGGVGIVALGGAALAGRWLERGGQLPGVLAERATPILPALHQFAAGLATVSSPHRALPAVGWTAMVFLLAGGELTLCMWAVGVEGTLFHAIFVLGMLGIGFAIPSPPTHAGTYHFFAAQALQLSGVATPEQALAFAVLAHAFQVGTVSVFGLLSTIGLDWRGRAP